MKKLSMLIILLVPIAAFAQQSGQVDTEASLKAELKACQDSQQNEPLGCKDPQQKSSYEAQLQVELKAIHYNDKSEEDYQTFKKKFTSLGSLDELQKDGFVLEARGSQQDDSNSDCPSYFKLEVQGPFAVLTVNDETWALTLNSLNLPANLEGYEPSINELAHGQIKTMKANYVQKFGQSLAVIHVDQGYDNGSPYSNSSVLYVSPGDSKVLVQAAADTKLPSDEDTDTCVLVRLPSNSTQIADDKAKPAGHPDVGSQAVQAVGAAGVAK
jgi:hypothetical protein